MQYNYQKYVELLKHDDSLRKQNKFLKDENKLKYLELKNYSLQINEHLHWSQKDEYLQLIEDFLSFKINGKTFESKFCSMVEAIEKKCRLLTKNYEMLKNIKPSSISFEFVERYQQQHSENLLRFLQMENPVDLFHQNRDKIHHNKDKFLKSISQIQKRLNSA